MKSKMLLITIALVIISLYLGYKLCNVECDDTQTDCTYCEPCKGEEVREINMPLNSDLTFKINSADTSNFQPFQYDILNSYGILGQIYLDENNSKKISKIDFELLEVGKCNRWKIESVSYLKDSNGHNIEYKINKYHENGTPNHADLNTSFEFEIGDDFNIRITSDDDPRIVTPAEGIYPPFICFGKIVDIN
ncbi:hypothetical protein [Psychroserpens ponticola]|uniref:Uncharacterized protein n=1 Tax=Psychroserpens ponticola TaxID=2932268 RepID=A0ABY7S0N0_9FLAO|nr:hypothetical protein [Psychroserpens ponticola]WCO02698.1 hypothetical protein MUN68_004185 [Psychroserpens ponticola]